MSIPFTGIAPLIPFSQQGEFSYTPVEGFAGDVLTMDAFKRKVWIKVLHLSATPAQRHKIVISLDKSGVTPNGVLVSKSPQYYYTDVDGYVEFELWQNIKGMRRCKYLLTVIDGKTNKKLIENERFVVRQVDANILDLLEFKGG